MLSEDLLDCREGIGDALDAPATEGEAGALASFAAAVDL